MQRVQVPQRFFSGASGSSSSVVRISARKIQRSEEHTSELQSLTNLVCRLLLEKKKKTTNTTQSSKKTTKKQKARPNNPDNQHPHTKRTITPPTQTTSKTEHHNAQPPSPTLTQKH